jgi:cell division protein FtsQ
MVERIPALKKEERVKPRRGKRLIRILISLFIIVLIILFFRSPLSEVSKIQITGMVYVSEEEIVKALGVNTGDSFFIPGANRLKEKVQSLNPVESVIITKKFPGVIRVEIKEYPQVAVQLTADGQVLPVLSNGLSLPATSGRSLDMPILSGWQSEDPNLTALCIILSGLPSYLLADLSEIHPDPSTSYPNRIKLFTRSRFEIVTTVDKLPDRISYLSDIVQNREPGKIIMLEADTYLPYSAENVTEETQ